MKSKYYHYIIIILIVIILFILIFKNNNIEKFQAQENTKNFFGGNYVLPPQDPQCERVANLMTVVNGPNKDPYGNNGSNNISNNSKFISKVMCTPIANHTIPYDIVCGYRSSNNELGSKGYLYQSTSWTDINAPNYGGNIDRTTLKNTNTNKYETICLDSKNNLSNTIQFME